MFSARSRRYEPSSTSAEPRVADLAVHAADVRQPRAVAAARAAVARRAAPPKGKSSWPQCMTVSFTVTPPDATASRTPLLGPVGPR